MGITLYGGTLVGAVTGALTPLVEVTLGGLKLGMIAAAAAGDVDRIATNFPLGVVEGPITATLLEDKTVLAACRAKLLARTKENWTFTDEDTSTFVGSGYISGVSNVRHSLTGESQYDVEITPETKWTFTAGS
jgi:hypothetical protein